MRRRDFLFIGGHVERQGWELAWLSVGLTAVAAAVAAATAPYCRGNAEDRPWRRVGMTA